MRNNHDKKTHKLGKRTFALCLALAVICSCLLPVFATGNSDAAVMLPEDGGIAMPVAGDDSGAVVQPGGGEIAMPVIPGDGEGTASSGSESGSTPVTDPSSVKGVTFPEGATNIVKNPNGSYSYDTAYGRVTVFPDADKADMGDGTVKPNPNMKEDDAAFGVLPITYHFWLKKMDSFDLDDLTWEAEMADLSETEYLSLYGSSKKFPIWHMDTISADDVMGNYTFNNPTSLNDPEGKGREFAGWYTVDSLGVESEFEFYKSYGDESNTTINVFAKWKDASGDVVEEPKTDDTKSEETKDETKQEETKADDTKKDEEKKEEAAATSLSAVAAISDTASSSKQATVAAEGMPAEAIRLSVTRMGSTGSLKEFYNLYKEQDPNGALDFVIGFNITPMDKDGVKVQPNGLATVTISGLNDLLDSRTGIKVLHKKADGQIETLDATYNNGVLTFQTSSFSQFVITADAGKATTLEATSDVQPLYLYALLPNITWDGSQSGSNSNWYGIGIAKIDAAKLKSDGYTFDSGYNITFSPNTIKGLIDNKTITLEKFTGQYTYKHSSDSKNDQNNDYKTGLDFYPDLTVESDTGNKVTYKYWDKSSGQEQPNKAYYTLEWVHLGVPYGAASGLLNGYNQPTVGDKLQAYHLDARITLSDMCNVDFEVLNPNETVFELLDAEKYSQTVSKGTSITKILQPQNQKDNRKYDVNQYPGYKFDGWYKDSKFKEKADFNGSDTIDKDTVYYGRYVPITTSVTITKEVTGLLGDHNGEFNFTVSFAEGTDTTSIKATKKGASSTESTNVPGWSSFTLKDGETITFTGVPIGAEMTVTETAPGKHYTVKATEQSDKSGEADASFTYKIVAASDTAATAADATASDVTVANNAIIITNDAGLIPDSGVILDTLPYIVILAVVVGGGVMLFLRKRRKDDED